MPTPPVIRVFVLLFAGWVLFWTARTAAAQQPDKQRLKDLFEFQWLASHAGQTQETAGEEGHPTLAGGVPVWFTSNADSSRGGAQRDVYYGPWIRGDWRNPIDVDMDWYAGATLVDYLYTRDSGRNYSYAEVSAGLTKTLARTERFSAEAYAGLAFDYDLTFTQYIGANLDWQVTDSITLGLICIYVLQTALKKFGSGNFAFRRIGSKALGKWRIKIGS